MSKNPDLGKSGISRFLLIYGPCGWGHAGLIGYSQFKSVRAVDAASAVDAGPAPGLLRSERVTDDSDTD